MHYFSLFDYFKCKYDFGIACFHHRIKKNAVNMTFNLTVITFFLQLQVYKVQILRYKLLLFNTYLTMSLLKLE